MVKLKTLNLAHCDALRAGALATVLQMPSLTSLDLTMVVGDNWMPNARHPADVQRLDDWILPHGSNLEKLSLVYCSELTDEMMDRLSTITSLTDLNLLNCGQVTDVGYGQLAALTNLRSLALGGCDMGNVGCDTGNGGVCNLTSLSRSLRHLNLCNISQLTANGLSSIASFPALHSLSLERMAGLTDNVLKRMTSLPHLVSFHLGWCRNITHAGMNHFLRHGLSTSLNLKHITIKHITIDENSSLNNTVCA
jgi:F-box/leucine-rich repeat protein 14